MFDRWASVFVLISVMTVGLQEPHGVRAVFVVSELPLGCGSLCSLFVLTIKPRYACPWASGASATVVFSLL